MARTGVLSDESIKRHCPEMFPLPADQYKLLQPITIFPKHKLTGIKEEKGFRDYIEFARFPDNDFRNIANILSINNRELAGLRSIVNYRELVGSKNIPDNVSLEALANIRFRNAAAVPAVAPTAAALAGAPSAAAAPATSAPTAGTSTILSQAPTGGGSVAGPSGVSSQLDFSMTGRVRNVQLQSFKSGNQAIAKYFQTNAKAFIAAFPQDTRDAISAHYRSTGRFDDIDKGGGLGQDKITAEEVRNYLFTQNPTPKQKNELENLLAQAKIEGAQTMVGSFAIQGQGQSSQAPAPAPAP